MSERPRASFSKFQRVKPKPVSLAPQEMVRFGELEPGAAMPLLAEPASADVDAAGWAAANRSEIDDKLDRHGAILFRGFDLRSEAEFETFAAAVCPTLFGDYGDLPPEEKGGKIYRATPYPATKTILFHNESSHTHRWPLRQMFFCALPAERGGETPIVDGRRIYERLQPSTRERFEREGLLYLRNFSPGLDVSWQAFFRTESRDAVESYCRKAGIRFEWHGDSLRTWQRAPAVLRHPRTGEKIFFNQIQLHHIACMEEAERDSLLALFGEEGLPRNVTYGEGEAIPDQLVDDLLELYWQESVGFPWQRGDVLVVDNMLVSHARKPYEGPRKINVAMGQLVYAEELAEESSVHGARE